MADANFNNLQPPPPGFSQDDLKSRLKKAALEIKEEDDHLIKPREPFKDNDHLKKREKRAAVKKNLGSHSYHESSMIAGQAADFPGGVTISENTMNEALFRAKHIKEAERPRHRSPFPQMELNESHIFRNDKFEESGKGQGVDNHLELQMKQNLSSVENVTDYKLKKTFKGDFWNQKLVGNRSLSQPPNLSTVILKTGPIVSQVKGSNIMNSSNPRVISFRGNGGKVFSQIHNLTRAKQLLHSQMEHDLNESADQLLMEKGN